MPVWTLALKDLRLLARDRRAGAILPPTPVVVILVLGLALGETFGQKPDDRLRVSVVDEDRGPPPAAGLFPGEPWARAGRRGEGGAGGPGADGRHPRRDRPGPGDGRAPGPARAAVVRPGVRPGLQPTRP